MNLAAVVLVVAVAVALYPYVGYPLILRVLATRRTDPIPGGPAAAAWPTISITIPAYNEEHAIGETLDRLLEADYPADRRQIMVVSDASTDGTDEVVRGYADRGVELLRVPTRSGKTGAENAARERLKGEIIVNTDASVRIAPTALKPLVAAFRDPQVGVASARDVSVSSHSEDATAGESNYVGYEMWVRGLETRLGGIVGASGCLYAIRRELHMKLVPSALSRDFAAALIAREHGFRTVSVNDAICYVPRAGSLRREFRRKVRTMTRGLETLWYKRALMHPWRYGGFALKLISHKLARWLGPWAVAIGVAATTWIAAGMGAVPPVALAVGLIWLLAIGGWFWPESRPMPRALAIPSYVVWGLTAGIFAWIKAMRGELNPIWEPTRREAVSRGS